METLIDKQRPNANNMSVGVTNGSSLVTGIQLSPSFHSSSSHGARSVSSASKVHRHQRKQMSTNSIVNGSDTSLVAFSSSSRIYRAPQPSIRRYQNLIQGDEGIGHDYATTAVNSQKSEGARRRRREAHSTGAIGVAINKHQTHPKRSSAGTVFSLDRQLSDNSLTLDGSGHEQVDYTSDVEDYHFYSNNDEKVGISSTPPRAAINEALSTGRTNASSLFPNFVPRRYGSRHSGHSTNAVPAGNTSNTCPHDSYSIADHSSFHNNDDESERPVTYDGPHYQSDIPFAENDRLVHPNHKKSAYRTWCKFIGMNRAANSKAHASPSSFRYLPLRLSSCMKNSCGSFKPIGAVCRWWQLLFMVVCALITFDARKTIQEHRLQILLYDEERAHILEQMTWIDNAAKRVHSNYYQKAAIASINNSRNALLSGEEADNNESSASLRKRHDDLQHELNRLQIKIQVNARDRIRHQFGDKPIHIHLPLSFDDESQAQKTQIEHLVIALSDDTPHAASTLLQQVNKKLWDSVTFQRVVSSVYSESGEITNDEHQLDCIQISPKVTAIKLSPALEFVEKSRKCHLPGSVALHQLESEDFHVTVLKVHISEDIHSVHHDEGDVCIGTVIEGLEELVKRLPTLPAIRKEDSVDGKTNEHSTYNRNATDPKQNMNPVNIT